MCIESVMPSNHLILCRPLLPPPSIFPSIRVFSNESALRIRWPKYWSFSFNVSPSNEHSGLSPLGWTGWICLRPRDFWGFPGGTSGKEPACQCRRPKRLRFNPGVRKTPWRRAWQRTSVFLPGESYIQRSLVGYGP